jgi:hypothetical protein
VRAFDSTPGPPFEKYPRLAIGVRVVGVPLTRPNSSLREIKMRACNYCGAAIKGRADRKSCCSLLCVRLLRQKIFIENWLAGNEKGTRGKVATSARIKRYLIEIRGNKCEKCGWGEMNPTTNKVPIELEHIDGQWDNNKIENLILLCPNCHSLTSTYRSLNTGSGRSARKYLLVSDFEKVL